MFPTQISPENYENFIQTMKTGMFNLCDDIEYHKRMLAVYEIAMDEGDLV